MRIKIEDTIIEIDEKKFKVKAVVEAQEIKPKKEKEVF